MAGGRAKRIPLLLLILFLVSVLLRPGLSTAEVRVFDGIALKGDNVRLCAQTRGKLFAMGGELVDFFIGTQSLGKTLSGGDGFAYKTYTPQTSGRFEIKGVFDDEQDIGILLVLRKGARLVFVDVAGGCWKNSFPRIPEKGACRL